MMLTDHCSPSLVSLRMTELHYGPSFLLPSVLYAHFNKHVVPNQIFLQMSSWKHCAILTDGKKCLAWCNYLHHWPQCLMRTIPLCDIPGGIFPLQPCRHFKNRWELYLQSTCWSMMSKCCSNSFVSADLLGLFAWGFNNSIKSLCSWCIWHWSIRIWLSVVSYF